MGTRKRSRTSVATRRRTSVADALFTLTQQRVLGLLFGQPERSFFAREIVELAESGTGAVQRELERLVDSGLVTSRLVGRQRHYQANPDTPVFDALRTIVLRTVGFVEPLRAALAPLADRIRFATIYGSVAKGSATSHSDLDVLIVGDELTLEDIFKTLSPVEARLARKISPTLYTTAEFRKRRSGGNAFITKVLSGVNIPILGTADVAAPAR